MRRWLPLIILAAAQFVMVLDSSVMNVSISQIVADLDTTVTGVQLAITAYTLVMAAFMLVGAKLGDIWGRDRAFAIGLAVYGLGSLTTALSPNLGVLLVGWSLVEGLGAVLVIPAIAALIAANYEGKDRAFGLRDHRRRRRRGDRGRAGDRRLGDDELLLALRLRRRGRRRHLHPHRAQPNEGGAAAREPAEARRRRCGALGCGPRSDRVRDPAQQLVGLDPADRRARRSGARRSPLRLLGRAVPDPRRVLPALVLQPLGEHRDRLGKDTLLDRRCSRSRRCEPAWRR